MPLIVGAREVDQLDPGAGCRSQIGKGNAKARPRQDHRDGARKMGLTHPLGDSSSLPIGAAEVTVIDMTASYAVFANGGKRGSALCGRAKCATRTAT